MTHKVCRGTDYGWGHSGMSRRRYDEYKRRYTNCTIVNGNLELVFLEDPPYDQYDLSFLSSIRSVLTIYEMTYAIRVQGGDQIVCYCDNEFGCCGLREVTEWCVCVCCCDNDACCYGFKEMTWYRKCVLLW